MRKLLKAKFVLASFVAAATFILFVPALHNEFVEWDDVGYVLDNPHIRSFNAGFFKWAFFDFYKSNWHPLTWISHALDYAMWGVNPVGHHLTNIILHSINSFLVVVLIIGLMEVLRDRKTKTGSSIFMNAQAALLTGGVTGLLFGLHPLHVESVVWVAERKDLLCACFFLFSILSYKKYAYGSHHKTVQQENPLLSFLRRDYLLTLGFFALALLSKPMAVSLPVVLLLLDWYPFERIRSLKTFGVALAEKLPFITLSLISSALTILAQKGGDSLAPLDSVTLSKRILVAAGSLINYLWKMILPLDLIPFYPYAKNISFFPIEYAVPSILVIGLTVLCVVNARKHRVWPSVWAYYVITLLPVIGLVQVGSQSMADRYTYLPSLGPFLVLGLAAAAAWGKVSALARRRLIMQIALGAMAVFLFISLSLLTRAQIGIWKDSITLWSYVIEKEPGTVPRAYNNRANAFYKMGLTDKAIADYDEATRVNPFFYEAYANRGVLYGNAGLADKAIESFNMSLAINPKYPYGYCNRGITYARAGRYDLAIGDFNKAIALNANYANAYYNRGSLYFETGEKELAASDFQKACGLGNQNGCRALRAY